MIDIFTPPSLDSYEGNLDPDKTGAFTPPPASSYEGNLEVDKTVAFTPPSPDSYEGNLEKENPGTFTTLGNEFKAAAAKGAINTVGGVARAMSEHQDPAAIEQGHLGELQTKAAELQGRIEDPQTSYDWNFGDWFTGKPTGGSREDDAAHLAQVQDRIKETQAGLDALRAEKPNALQQSAASTLRNFEAGAGQVADVMDLSAKEADTIYNANPNDQSIPAQIGRGAGNVFAMAPAMVGTGGAGVVLGTLQGASQSYAEAFNSTADNLRAAGVTDQKTIDDAAHQAASTAAVKTLPALGLYMVGGRLASNAVGALFKESAPLVKGIAGGIAATGANVAAGSLIRAAEGQNPVPNAENLTMDAAFGGLHGFSTGMEARKNMVSLNPKGESNPKQPAATNPQGLRGVKVEQHPAGMTPLSEILPSDAAGPERPADGKPAEFKPSREWQEVPEGTAVPAGGEYRVDMEAGKSYARWPEMPEEKAQKSSTLRTIETEEQAADILSAISESEPKKTIKGKVDEIAKWFLENLSGQTLKSPIGMEWKIKPGHLFRLIAGKPKGQRKGFVEGYDSSESALDAIVHGKVSGDSIAGYADFRAQHITSVKDLYEHPDLILQTTNAQGESGISHLKWYSGKSPFLLAGFKTAEGDFALLTFHPKGLKPSDLVGKDVLYQKDGNRVPRPAAPGPLTGEQKAGSDLPRSYDENTTSGENVNPESGMKKPEGNPEGGFAVADIPQAVADFGRSIYRAGMDFAEWSGRMLKELGESARGHLANLWKALKEHFSYLPGAGERGGIGSKTDDLGKRDPEFENAVAEAAKDPEKRRKFIQSVKDAEAVMPDVKSRVEGVYEPISNKVTVDEAKTWINEKGIDGSLADLLTAQAPSARDYAAGIELIGRLQAGGRFEDAAALVEHMAERATDQGRAIQALSLLSRLSPEGIDMYAQRQVQKAVKASPENQRRYGDLAHLKGELRKSREGMAGQATIHSQTGSGENVQVRINRLLVKNQDSLWGRYKQGAVAELERKIMGPDRPRDLAPLDAFTIRLKRNLMDQLPPALRKRAEAAPEDQAALLGEAVRNFDKYKEVWNETQRQVQETYKSNPEALQALDEYFGQILKRPFSEKSLGKAVRQVMDEMNISIKQVLAQGIGDKAKSRAMLAKVIVDRSGLHGDEATALAHHISKHFEKLQQGARDALLRQMTQIRGTDRVKRSTLQRLMEQNNAGVLDDQRFFGALAKQYGIPVWTPELSARVQKLQREYEVEKNPSVKLAKAAQMLDAVHEMIPSDVFTKARAVMNLAMLLNPKTVIRNIGGNQAMWLADVAADSVSRWVVDPMVGIFTGQRTRRSVDVAARLSGFAEPVRDFWNGYGSAREAGASKSASASEGVKTMLALAKLGSNGKYDLADISRGNTHIFSSQFGRLLENTLSVMLSIPDRAFHQSAFKGSVIRQMKLAEARGEKLVSPTPEILQEAAMDGARAIFEDKNFVSESLGDIGRALNKLTTLGHSDRYGLGAVMLPFTQIPGSIALRGAEWTPLGFIRSSYEVMRPAFRRDFRQKEFVDSFSRALLGSGIAAATGYWLSHLGIVSAVGEEDKDLEAMRKDSGYGKYRVNKSALKRAMMSGNWWMKQQAQPGDVMVNYDWLQPVAMPVAMGAEIYHQQEMQRLDASQGKDSAVPPSLRAFAAGGFAAVKTLEDQPLLTGITRAARDVGQDGVGKGIAKQSLAAPGMFVPTALSQINQLFDNKMRVTNAGDPVDQAAAQIISRIPGLSEKYPVKYNAFGEAQERYQYGGNSFFNVMLNPAFVTRVKANPALQEIEHVYAATGDKEVIPKQAPVKLQLAGQSVELTNDQISQYQHTAGMLTLSAYSRLAASPQFAAAPVGAKAAVMDKVMDGISNVTKLQVLAGNPDLVALLRTQMQQKAQAQRALMTVP